jgi:hypothetical protein
VKIGCTFAARFAQENERKIKTDCWSSSATYIRKFFENIGKGKIAKESSFGETERRVSRFRVISQHPVGKTDQTYNGEFDPGSG